MCLNLLINISYRYNIFDPIELDIQVQSTLNFTYAPYLSYFKNSKYESIGCIPDSFTAILSLKRDINSIQPCLPNKFLNKPCVCKQ